MLNNILDTFANFILMDRLLLDNIISLLIYSGMIFLALKNGANGTTFIVAYIITSSILTVLGISSIFNIVSIITGFIKDLLKSFNPFATNFIRNVLKFCQN